MALTLIPYLAAFHFFDALQTVASFVLRAYKLAIAPTVIHAAALWGLGVVGVYVGLPQFRRPGSTILSAVSGSRRFPGRNP